MASSLLDALNLLHDHHVDFVIVGGVAATLHGGSRVTFDLDVVPRLTSSSWKVAVDLLWSLGARPRIPEPAERIWDVEQIQAWRQEKGMVALNLRTPDGAIDVDRLVAESDDFDGLRERAVAVTIEGRSVYVASIDELIRMKRQAGRPQDPLDLEQLEAIKSRQ